MSSILAAQMVHNTVQLELGFVAWLAVQREVLVKIDFLCYFLVVHVLLRKHESFQMHDEHLRQSADLCLLLHIVGLVTEFAL